MKFKIEDTDENPFDQYYLQIEDGNEEIVSAYIDADLVEDVGDAYTEVVTDPDVLRTLANLIETGDPVESPGL